MENGKKILTPSVIHDNVPEVKKPEHLRKNISAEENVQPENPDRNYHHEQMTGGTSRHVENEHADDDIWDGEDA